MTQQTITTDFISTDPTEPIILIRDFPVGAVLGAVEGLFDHAAFNPDSHVHVRDESFLPPVNKKCSDISTGGSPILQGAASEAVKYASVASFFAGHGELAEFLRDSSERELWAGPALMVYGEEGFMSAHRDKAKVDEETGRPLYDGLLIGINIGLACYFSFKTTRGHESTLVVPSGSVVIFDAVLTEHAIHVIPGSCPPDLAQKYPTLAKYRLSIISRQSLSSS